MLRRSSSLMREKDSHCIGLLSCRRPFSDEYEAKRGITVNFNAGSFKLTPEAMASLDEIAVQAKSEKAYVIEITGYASSEGGQELNKRLSQQRADAVVRYLADNHMIPLRRTVTARSTRWPIIRRAKVARRIAGLKSRSWSIVPSGAPRIRPARDNKS